MNILLSVATSEMGFKRDRKLEERCERLAKLRRTSCRNLGRLAVRQLARVANITISPEDGGRLVTVARASDNHDESSSGVLARCFLLAFKS